MKLQQILTKVNLNTVTSEQIGRCHLVISQTGEKFYQVESESDSQVEYTVRYSKEFGFTCTCKSGQEAFVHCKLGVCKHVVWALAAKAEERQALAEMEKAELARKASEEHVLVINGEVQPKEVVDALFNRKGPREATKREIEMCDKMSNRPFRLMK